MARTRRTAVTRQVSARTARNRARRLASLEQQRKAARQVREGPRPPETMGQARVWQRKCHRYELAGLCDRCASAAAWGHAEGFGALEKSGRVPCDQCQPLVNAFPSPGPRGSKWRKILDKLEYMSEESLGEWLDAHEPKE
jgi:hypothetical protein